MNRGRNEKNRWERDLPEVPTRQDLETQAASQGAAQTLGMLAGTFWNDEEFVADRLGREYGEETVPFTIRRIAFYYFRMYNGGIERVISQLLPVFQSLGYEVYLITDEPADPMDYSYPDTVHRLLLPKAAGYHQRTSLEHMKLRAQAMEELVQQYHIDTVFYHAWYSKYLLWELLLFRLMGVHLLVETHNVFAVAAVDWPWQARWRSEVFRMAEGIITLSRVDALYWSRYAPAYYVANPMILAPQEEVSTLQGDCVLWVGRLCEQKNPEAMVDVFAKVHQRLPEAKLLMVGQEDPGTGFEKKVRQRIARWKLKDNVQLLGYQQDMAQLYRSASVLTMTSWYEGFPMTLAEGKSYGLPVVMLDIPYLEFAREGKGLFALPPGDIQGMADTIVELLQQDALRRQAGEEARKSAESFCRQGSPERWREVLDKCCRRERENSSLPREAAIALETMQSYIPLMIKKTQTEKMDLRGWLNDIFYEVETEDNSARRLGKNLRRGIVKAAYTAADVCFPIHTRRREVLKDVMRKVLRGKDHGTL